MNTSLQKAFDKLESSLAILLESVSANNPSPPAALALVAADDEVSAQLNKLVTHQQNHVRLQRLRHLSSLLDSELTSLLTTLSNTRGEIINVPSTRFEKGTYRKVDYASLLAYATKISRYTRVAAAAVADEDNAPVGGDAAGAEGDGAGSGSGGTGAGAGAADTTGGDNKPEAKNDKNAAANATGGGGGAAGQGQQKQKGKDGKDDAKNGNAADTAEQAAQANKAGGDKNRMGLTHEEAALVDPSSGMPFAPWPSEQIIQRGLLARMDYEGITAQEFIERQERELLAKQQAEAGISQEGREGQRMETLEKAQVQGMDREKATEAARAREEKKAAVFTGLDLYDPDAED